MAKSKSKRTFSTDVEVRNLRPGNKSGNKKQQQVWTDWFDQDHPGLAVRVGPYDQSGQFRRVFVFIGRLGGAKNPGRHRLGEYPQMSLLEARAKAFAWRQIMQAGVDPREWNGREDEAVQFLKRNVDLVAVREQEQAEQEERERQIEAERRVGKLAFETQIEAWLNDQIRGKLRSGYDIENTVRRELLPEWRSRSVAKITRKDVRGLVKAIKARAGPYAAHSTFALARQFFNWLADEDVIEVSPCVGLKPKTTIGKKSPRTRHLDDDELRAFWRATGRLGYPFGDLHRLIILTGVRISEASDARWREFDPDLIAIIREHAQGDRRVDWSAVPDKLKRWRVPPERFKSEVEHLVTLSGCACELLETLPRFNKGDCLFSTNFGERPVGGFSKAKKRLDRHMLAILRAMARKRGADPSIITLPRFTHHDLRRTVRTRLSGLRLGEKGDRRVDFGVAELILGHAKKELQRVYDQHEYADEMHEALTAWSHALLEIVEPQKPPAPPAEDAAEDVGQVIRLRPRAARQ